VTRVTLSKLALLFHCGAWARTHAQWHDPTSEYAALGNEIDAPFANYIRTGGKNPGPAIFDDPRAQAMWRVARAWLDDNYVVGMRAQAVYAYDAEADKGREITPLPDAPPRFYALPEWRAKHGIADHEVCGSADLVCMGLDDDGAFVAIDDLKVRVGVDVKDATSQLSGLALAACRAYGVDRARIRTIIVDESRVSTIVQWLDEWSLVAVAEEIRTSLESIHDAQPAPGEWCADRYCPHLPFCLAKQQDIAEAEALVPADALVRRRGNLPLTLTIQSPDHAADILARVRAAEKVLGMLKGAVGEYVGEEGRTLSDGSRLEHTYRTVSRVSSKAVEQLAREAGATDEQLALCVTTAREGAGIKVVAAAKAKRGRAA